MKLTISANANISETGRLDGDVVITLDSEKFDPEEVQILWRPCFLCGDGKPISPKILPVDHKKTSTVLLGKSIVEKHYRIASTTIPFDLFGNIGAISLHAFTSLQGKPMFSSTNSPIVMVK
ncbi:hypothetical protein TrCOL_g13571 [Triparma columacea]|uniref:Uncharacterized protein n=1 Tax=Triparma columacea TaxID=722753 RepID=A0A9W7GJY7_9STRA|nr:hypothetical protein TrCOL_g13571 [Triparma columacea]